MARFEKNFGVADEAPLDVVEWISGLAKKDRESASESHGAKVARLLSGIDKGEALSGAFSDSGLTGRKAK